MKSIIQSEKVCFVCGTTHNLHKHHIIHGTANRKLSEKYGLTCWLCYKHHNGSNDGVHFNSDLDFYLKQLAEKAFLKVHGTIEDFTRIFGRNYL